MAITLSEAARSRVREFLSRDPGALGLRFGVRPTGCSGWAYVTELAHAIGADDAVFEDGGVRLLVDRASLPRVDGTRIDYTRKGLNHEFVYDNPNVTAECGCGESFSTDKSADFD